MPRFDKTGPRGMGPMTGRVLGPCGVGMGYGQGYGRGYGMGYGAGYGRNYLTREEEVSELKEEDEILRGDLRAIEERIKEISSGK